MFFIAITALKSVDDSTLEHKEKQVSKLYKNSWKVYKVCDKFLVWDSFRSVTIDTNTIVQVGKSEKMNFKSAESHFCKRGSADFIGRKGHGTVRVPKVVLC